MDQRGEQDGREGVGCDRNGQVNCIWLPSRNLEGTISTSIKSLSHLKELNFAHNKLSVRLPDGLFLSLNRLEILDFSYNRLSEEFQPFDHFPVSIKMVDLSSNGFSGVLHCSFLLQVWSLIGFNVSNNSFYGPLPTVIYNFLYSSITIVNFSFNYFNSSIPNGYGRCSKLKIPCAGFNSITGSLPDDIYQVSTLQELSLPGNGISDQRSNAQLDRDFAKPILLRFLNFLSGPLPRSVARLSRLASELIANRLVRASNELPVLLVQPMSRHLYLHNQLSRLPLGIYLNGHNLTGTILVSIGELHVLNLSHNNFTGSIPETVSHLISLEKLSFSDNSLFGEIPSSLKKLHFFQRGKQRSTAQYPLEVSLIHSQRKVLEGNPHLCGSDFQRPCSDPPNAPVQMQSSEHTENSEIRVTF
ncbi:receptor-like protein 2 [Coffea eugenioides]|uniref:receptor-like protein 2 n=1 Tax=Coffea eugenioides TaxID=49369 RepID=UPI000F6112E9|nr:receptor-like protein 2 [Coffea eugenioides]